MVTGSGSEISLTQSNSRWAIAASNNSHTVARVKSAYSFTFGRVKAWLTSRRSRVCSGGSVSIIDRRASSASGSRSSSAMCPSCEENSFGCLLTETTSACLESSQNPPRVPGHGCQWTGSCALIAASSACGMPCA